MIEIAAEKIAYIGGTSGIPITNSFITTICISSFLILIAFIFSRNIQLIPGSFQNTIEYIIEFMYNTAVEVVGDEERARRFFPIVATFFLFILLANWFGLFPFINAVGFFKHFDGTNGFTPLFRPINSDLNATLTLGVISTVVTQYYAIVYVGIWEHIKRYISLNPLYLFIGLLELLSEFTKIISLSFRLYGNIIAGDLVIATFTSIIGILLPLPFMGLEVVVGFVQATVFAMLSLAFTGILSKKIH